MNNAVYDRLKECWREARRLANLRMLEDKDKITPKNFSELVDKYHKEEFEKLIKTHDIQIS